MRRRRQIIARDIYTHPEKMANRRPSRLAKQRSIDVETYTYELTRQVSKSEKPKSDRSTWTNLVQKHVVFTMTRSSPSPDSPLRRAPKASHACSHTGPNHDRSRRQAGFVRIGEVPIISIGWVGETKYNQRETTAARGNQTSYLASDAKSKIEVPRSVSINLQQLYRYIAMRERSYRVFI